MVWSVLTVIVVPFVPAYLPFAPVTQDLGPLRDAPGFVGLRFTVWTVLAAAAVAVLVNAILGANYLLTVGWVWWPATGAARVVSGIGSVSGLVAWAVLLVRAVRRQFAGKPAGPEGSDSLPGWVVPDGSFRRNGSFRPNTSDSADSADSAGRSDGSGSADGPDRSDGSDAAADPNSTGDPEITDTPDGPNSPANLPARKSTAGTGDDCRNESHPGGGSGSSIRAIRESGSVRSVGSGGGWRVRTGAGSCPG